MEKLMLIPIVLSLLAFTSCNEANGSQSDIDVNTPVNNYAISSTRKFIEEFIHTNHVFVYYLEKENYYKFLEEPSEYIFDDYTVTYLEMFKNSEIEGNGIATILGNRIDHGKAGIDRIGARLPVYTEFVDFAGSASALEEYLAENGIDAKVKQHFVIASTRPKTLDPPIFIWLETDVGNYCITLDEYGYRPTTHRSRFDCRLYTHDEYIEKHGTPQNTEK